MGDLIVGRRYRVDFIGTVDKDDDFSNFAVDNTNETTTSNTNVRFNAAGGGDWGQILNGDFENDFTSWTDNAGASIVSSSGHSSAKCAELETSGGGGSVGTVLQDITTVVDDQYLLVFWTKGGGVDLDIRFKISNVAEDETVVSTTLTGVETGGWTKKYYQFIAEHTTTRIKFYSPVGVDGTVLLDDVKVSKFEENYIDFTAGHATDCELFIKDGFDGVGSNWDLDETVTGWEAYGGSITPVIDDDAMKCERLDDDDVNDHWLVRTTDQITFEAGYKYMLTYYVRLPDNTGDYAASGGNVYMSTAGQCPAAVETLHRKIIYSTGGAYQIGYSFFDATGADNADADAGDLTAYLYLRSTGDLAAGDFVHMKDVNLHRLENPYIDNIKVREIGSATGFTEGTMETQGPQTALQSYNQIAWGNRDSSSRVECDPEPNFGQADFTISYSVFYQDNTHDQRFFCTGTSDDFIVRMLNAANNTIRIYMADGAGNNTGYADVTTDGELKLGQWNHIIERYNYSSGWGTLSVYVNGQRSSDSGLDMSGEGITDVPLNFASQHRFGGYSNPECIHGSITEIAYWKGVLLSQANCQELYNGGKILDARLAARSDKLIHYWRNEGTGPWKDLITGVSSTDNTFTESIIQTEGYDADGRDTQGFIMNRIRKTNSLNLVGKSSDYVNNYDGDGVRVPLPQDEDYGGFDSTEDGQGDFTIDYWFKYNTIPISGSTNEQPVAMFTNVYRDEAGATDNYAGVNFYIASDGYIDGYAYPDGPSGTDAFGLFSNMDYHDNKWHHLVAIFDREDTDLFYLIIDKVVKRGTSSDVAIGYASKSFWKFPLVIGSEKVHGHSHGVGRWGYDGFIDEFKIYKRVLTSDTLVTGATVASGEVFQNYNAGKRSHR